MRDAQVNLSGAKILVVGDVPQDLKVLCSTLEGADYQVQLVTSGEKTLEIADRFPPDLILLDVMMPGIDGYETCRRLKGKESTQDIPVIFLRDSDEVSGVVEGFRAGGVDYVSKPFQPEEVLARIHSHLKRAQMIEELAEKNREMTDLNAHLQQKVEARIREIEGKVKAVEDRDRVAQRLLSANKLHEIMKVLASTDLFRGLDETALRALAEEVEWVFLPGGERLIRQGDPGDALYVALDGRLRVMIRQEDGQDTTVGEIGRGECVGEMAILTEETRSASVYAIRDSNLVKLSTEAFNRFKQQYPLILEEIVQLLIRRLRAGQQGGQGTSDRASRGTTVALVSAGEGVALTEFAVRLREAFAKIGPALHLNAARLDGYLGEGSAQTPQMDLENRNITAWLNAQELSTGFVVYESDPSPSDWTGRCIRQADCILLVGRAGTDPGPGAIETAMLNEDSPCVARTELVLLYPDGNREPVDTQRWLAHRSVAAHHHIRLSEGADFDRLVRFLTNRAVCLVLSGGGARGCAHIGVIRALEEHGIPIDLIGGTSAGSFIAAQYAMGWGYDRMLEINKQHSSIRSILDLTIPVVSLATGRKAVRMLTEIFGDKEIEDLWIRYFCVSSDLTQGEVVVHQEGLLRKYVQACATLPGLLPPVTEKGHLLIDGGVLNNMPADVVKPFFGECRIIGVNVNPKVGPKTDVDYGEVLSGRSVLWNRINPFRKTLQIPTIFDILSRLSMLGSAKQAAELVENTLDLYIHPPLDEFGFLEFTAIDRIADVGYHFTKKKLAQEREWGD